MRRSILTSRFARNQDGVAAIELALLLPIMMLLFMGLIDVSGLLSENRRVSQSASTVADIVTRLPTPTTPAAIADSYEAVELIMTGAGDGPLRIEIYNYRMVSGAIMLIWRRDNGVGAACGAPNEGDLVSLTTAGNDIIVAVACLDYTPVVSEVAGTETLGAATFRLREQIAMRPRESLILNCPTC
jgi:Flp pilus assembly pilin Flp